MPGVFRCSAAKDAVPEAAKKCTNFEHCMDRCCILSHMDMKTCIFLTLGLLVGSGSGYSIDRPAGSTDNLQPPPLTPTPYTHQVKPLPSSKPARLGIVPGTVPQALVAQLELSGFPGVLVTKVMPDSPAAKAGLQEMTSWSSWGMSPFPVRSL